jgi:hypothetical protein
MEKTMINWSVNGTSQIGVKAFGQAFFWKAFTMKRLIPSWRYFLTAGIAGIIFAMSPGMDCWAQDSTVSSVNTIKKSDKKPETIIISDMSKCTPPSALTRVYEKDKWQLHDYETDHGVKGIMVSALPEHKVSELKLPLGAEGLYKIYLGIHYTRPHVAHEHCSYGAVEVKLSGDSGFRRVAFPATGKEQYKEIHESYWKSADLAGQSLIVRQQQYPYNRYHIPEDAGYPITLKDRGDMSNISYVRLVPLSEEEKRQWQSAQPRQETRKLAAFFCTGQFTGHTRGSYTYHPTSKESIKDEFEPYANSDFKILLFEAMRGNLCVYNTKIGDIGTKDNRWQKNWVDPLAELTKLSHANGMKIFAALRMIGVQMPMNRQPISLASHYRRHPEWAQLDREGIPASNWSLAFPEARKYWLSLLAETLEYGTDGVCLYLQKGLPLTGYEEPVVRSFQKKYGTDPRKLKKDDKRLQSHAAQYYTQFIREVRALVDKYPGRKLAVVFKMADINTPRPYFDVETWLKEDLVDYLLPSSGNLPGSDLMKKWRKIGGDDLHIWFRLRSEDDYVEKAKEYYETGADGLSIWDSERQHARIGFWAGIQKLGHIDQLDRLKKESKSYYRKIDLKKLDGLSTQSSYKEG